MKLKLLHYQVLCEVLENIHYIYDETVLAETILSRVAESLNAEAGTVFRIGEGACMSVLAAYGAPVSTLRRQRFEVGKGVAGWVAHYVQPVKVDDPKKDKRFTGAVDVRTGFKTRSIIAAPIMARGRPIGVIEFLNCRGGSFALTDLELISMVGREIGIAFENSRLVQLLEKARAFDETLLANLSAGLLVLDPEGRLVKVNPSARRILGFEAEVDEGRPLPVRQALKEYPELVSVLEGVLDSASPVLRREFFLKARGRRLHIGYSGVPMLGPDAVRLGSLLLFQDITAVG
jgi:PAS domain S-box-containing protein